MTLDYTNPDVWWREYAPHYQDRTWRDYRGLLAQAVRHGAGAPLLDLGCGYGFLVECARRFGIPAIGLEASADAVAESRLRHPEADVRLWQAEAGLPLETATVGVAVANQFIDHISQEDNRKLLAETLRVLQPGGVLLVSSPSRMNPHDDDLGHLSFFSPSEYRQLVSSFGFEVVEQPFIPQPVFGASRPGRFLTKAVTQLLKPERWAATIDLVARKPERSQG